MGHPSFFHPQWVGASAHDSFARDDKLKFMRQTDWGFLKTAVEMSKSTSSVWTHRILKHLWDRFLTMYFQLQVDCELTEETAARPGSLRTTMGRRGVGF
jgi:hypothetical protein